MVVSLTVGPYGGFPYGGPVGFLQWSGGFLPVAASGGVVNTTF